MSTTGGPDAGPLIIQVAAIGCRDDWHGLVPLLQSGRFRPGVADAEAERERVGRIEDVLMERRDPALARDGGQDGGLAAEDSVVPRMRPMNSVPMMLSCTKVSPSASSPRACSTASRAEVPVPQGDRSWRPRRHDDRVAGRAYRPAWFATDPANWVWLIVWMSGFSGCTQGIWTAAARLMRSPTSTSLAASELSSLKPRLLASTMQ